MAMVDMKRPKAEAGKAKGGIGAAPTYQDEGHPHVRLEDHHLKALGIHTMPKVGEKLHIKAHAMVHATSENQDRGDGGKARRHITLALHKMEMGGGKQPEMSDESQKAGAKAAIDKALKKGAGSESADGEED